MNEERTGKWLRQVEHIHGHMWHRYSITVNQVMVATVKKINYLLKVKFILINLILSSCSSFSSLRISSLLLKVSLVCLCSTMSDCRLLITVFNCRRSLSDFSCSPSLCLHLQNKDTIISIKINKVYLTLNKDTILLQMYIEINIFLLISMAYS